MSHRLLLPLALVLLAGALPAAVVNFPGGRIAVSHDGNANDTDDYNSSAFHIALLARAGLASRVVHFDYNSCTRETDADREAIMRSGIQQACQRFGLDFGVCFDDRADLAATIANFKAQAAKASAADPLWYVIGGPMDVPYRCISAVPAAQRQFIHCISHSSWNDTYGPHTFTQLGGLGAQLHHISSQNNYPFRCATTEWTWLRDSSDADLAWLFQWIDPKLAVDVSDAGMGFWLITGGPEGGLDKEATMAHIREILEGGAPPAVFTVSAGADRSLALSGGSATLTLNGTLGNIPAGATPTQLWSLVAGPGAAVIANPTALDTSATVTLPGTWQFRLAASAGGAADDDLVVFTVTEASAVNQRPVVNAGPDAAIALVGGSATLALDATVSDDGLPNGSLTVKWTRPSGPASVVFATATAIDTSVTFTAVGTYKLKLAANDGALIGSDTLLVTVTDGGSGGPATGALAVTGFVLVDAATDQPIPGFDPIPAGAVIDTQAIGTTALNLVARVEGAVASVIFALDAKASYRIDGVAPFTLGTSTGTDYNPWTVTPDTHVLVATPWSEKAGAGTAGTPASLTFTLVVPPSGGG